MNRPALLAASLLAVACGCERPPLADEVVPIDRIPANVMEVARKELPGYRFHTATKFKADGEDAYEIRGKDARGKTREVEVSASGKVIEIE